jgi:hypothetical protein
LTLGFVAVATGRGADGFGGGTGLSDMAISCGQLYAFSRTDASAAAEDEMQVRESRVAGGKCRVEIGKAVTLVAL